MSLGEFGGDGQAQSRTTAPCGPLERLKKLGSHPGRDARAVVADHHGHPVALAAPGDPQHAAFRSRVAAFQSLDRIAAQVAEDTEEMSQIMKLNRNQEGYFIEAHVKLRPVDMPSDGVFLCGTAHGPKLVTEAISQAQAAASRAVTFLAKDAIKLSAITAKVDVDHCVKCLTCVRSCPFGVPEFNINEKVIEINEAICHGCGVCASICPRQTIQLSFYDDDQIMCKIDALLEAEGM